jgi:ubiquinone/menaquinone biosynthesis C-methylase UbiE
MDEFKQAQKLYDQQALCYAEQANTNRKLLDTRKLVYSLLTPVTNKKILSIGCGDGTECVSFSKNGAEVVGIDSSSELITLAKNKYSELGIDFLVMDYEETSFENMTFDGIISIMSIMYKEDLTKVLLELKRILKPDGTMIVVVPHPVRKMIKYAHFDYFASGLHYETWEEVTRYNYYRTLEEYFRLIKASGLTIEKLLEPKPQLDEPYQVTNNVSEHLYPHSLIFVLQIESGLA